MQVHDNDDDDDDDDVMMCRFTRQEFLTGCKALKADSCKGIQSRLPDVAAQVATNPEMFKDLYRFTFKVNIGKIVGCKSNTLFYQFGLDGSSGQRILPIEMAVSLWLLVFSQSEPPILKKWLHFLEKHPQVSRNYYSVNQNFNLTFPGPGNTKRHLEHVSQLCQHSWHRSDPV